MKQNFRTMFFQQEIETLQIPKLRKLQNERLQELVKYVYHRVPFYKRKFDEANIHPSSIKSVEDLHRLPFTKKDDLRDQYPFGMFAVSMNEVARIHCSSGTTGKPTVVGYTKNDIEIFAEVCARSLAGAGAQPGMKLQNAYGYGLFTGGLGLHYGGEKLGMAVIPVSGGMTDRQILLLRDFQPEVMCCTPSYALTLAEEINKRGIDVRELNLKFMELGAEPWTDTIREEVQQGLNVVATNIYGLSEIMGPGVSQEDYEERGTGSHVWEDHFYPEVVHPETGEPMPEGEYGVLCFTTLTKEAMPLIRYWTNDITNLQYDKNSKRTHIKMGAIRGRADDMLIIRGVNLFPSQIEAVLNDLPEFSPHYQLVVSRDGTMDEVDVHVEFDEKIYKELKIEIAEENDSDFIKSLHQKLSHKIKANIGLSMNITIKNYGTVPRSEGGKLSRVVDKRRT
ncbi:MAG TPA: phenylacetate--CoA ligase [Chitinophagales bacterium]|nr:phenylacetate--CoA ligase [Chitinophagales bacterium]